MSEPAPRATPASATPFAPFSIEGHYQDGLTSRSRAARLDVHIHGCDLTAGDVLIQIAPEDLRLSDRISNTPRRISWGSAACFVTSDNTTADRLRKLLPGSTASNLAYRLENHMPLAIGSLVLVAALLLAGLVWGVPAGAHYLAFQIPDSVRESSARQAMELIDEFYVDQSDLPPQRQSELESYFRAADNYPAKILFRNGKEFGANAFALPGGYIVFTDQIVALAEDDSELLGVYLHEVGHARLRHAETSVLRDSIWLVALTLVTGDISGVSETIYAVPVALGEMAFSRDLEREADDFAIKAMFDAGEEPAALASLLMRLTQGQRKSDDADQNALQGVARKLQEYLSTHPATGERLARIRSASRSAPR